LEQKKLVFLRFSNVDPKALNLAFPSRCHKQP
jgi:hypothetical protein